MGFKFNVFTGALDLTSDASLYTTDLVTLTPAQITAGEVTLSATPTTANQTLLLVQGAPSQQYSLDYTVTGNVLSWSGLGLDGVLIAGDNLTIIFN